MGKMSAKRRPGTELNHENWDQDEEDEEQGEFPKASESEIKQRVMKVARRRVRATDDADGEPAAAAPATGVFSGFSGFGNIGKSTSSPFSFLSSTTKSDAATTVSPFSSIPSLSASGTSSDKGANKDAPAPAINFGLGSKLGAEAPKTPEKSSAYYAKLKGLNQNVAAWITKCVDSNPLCLLTPIFEDYDKHLKEIDKSGTENPPATIKTPDFTFSSAATSSKSTDPVPKLSFGFGSSSTKTETTNSESSSTKPSSVFQTPSFGTSTAPTSAAPATSTFSFGALPAATSTASTGFSFSSSSTPFSFGNLSKPTPAAPPASAPAADDEDEEPPKNEFTPVVEEDSLFSKRCKVFVKTGGEFVDRGVGQLFIKSADEGKKTQLLVRADTNLGNILLNILLTEAVPASRMGKNNVMMICIPTPDSKPPASTVLVRVKNAEEADELLAQIEKHKK